MLLYIIVGPIRLSSMQFETETVSTSLFDNWVSLLVTKLVSKLHLQLSYIFPFYSATSILYKNA